MRIAKGPRSAAEWRRAKFGVSSRFACQVIADALAFGRPVEAVYSQHSGAERCPWSAVETRPDVARPQRRVRRQRATVVPPVEPLGDWADWPGLWGGARAGWVPGEMDSPRGPAHHRTGPEAFARAARRCTFDRCDEAGECDSREVLLPLAAPLVAALAVIGLRRRRSSEDAEHLQP